MVRLASAGLFLALLLPTEAVGQGPCRRPAVEFPGSTGPGVHEYGDALGTRLIRALYGPQVGVADKVYVLVGLDRALPIMVSGNAVCPLPQVDRPIYDQARRALGIGEGA